MITAKFAGNKKVNVEAEGFTVNVDLPKSMGGDDTAPNPFVLLMATLLSCSAIHLLGFIDKFGMKQEDFSLELIPGLDEKGDMAKAVVKVYVPADFPQDKENLLKGVIDGCKVGRHLKTERSVEIIRK